MMHSNAVVACVKVNGRILRESGDTVTLPFGSEYSIFLKNLHSVRTQIRVSVDGTDATDGTRLIIEPNSSLELERFIRNGNLQTGNRFRFIERSLEVEAHRGIGADDGLIRMEAWKELARPYVPVPHYYDDWTPRPYPRYPWRPGEPWMASSSRLKSSNPGGSLLRMAMNPTFASSDAGITVAGSRSHQQFHPASGFELEPQSTVIVLHLRGTVAGATVVTPVTVDLKPVCFSCGRTNRARNKYCSGCGTAVVLI